MQHLFARGMGRALGDEAGEVQTVQQPSWIHLFDRVDGVDRA